MSIDRTMAKSTKETLRNESIVFLRRRPVIRKQPNPSADRTAVAPELSMSRFRSRRSIALADSASVTVVVAAAPDGVTVEGLKLHVTEAGSPEHAKLIEELNPLTGVTVRVAEAAPPFVTVPLVTLKPREKSGVGIVMETVTAGDVEVAKVVAPP
jgi:hypothetical protein